MKRISLIALIVLASSGATFAGPKVALESSAQVTLHTLAPDLETEGLTEVQISQINAKASSDNGITRSQLLTILGR